MDLSKLAQQLSQALGEDAVLQDAQAMEAFAGDYTEEQPRQPGLVVRPRTTEQVQDIVRLAAAAGASLTTRVAGSNVGGLAIPPQGGMVVDLSQMNRILAVEREEMYALIEPGVTWQQLTDHLSDEGIPLRMGYPLSPPDTSIVANCLLDGLGNLSLRHGAMAQWVSGLEVVLPDGQLARTGAGALSDLWFGRSPLPDLSGLFVSFQGTTGIVTKLAFQLWPEPPHRQRAFVLVYERDVAFRAMRDLARMQICDDVGGLSWTTGKMLFGVQHPQARDPAEPEFFLYLDLSGQSARELALRLELLDDYLGRLRGEGLAVEPPFTLEALVTLNPEFGKLASFPTRLEFLVDHPGGGLTWVGTYGPMSRFEAYATAAVAILERYGVPPTIVSRPMNGGHFGVMRFITLFEQGNADEQQRVRQLNEELVDAGVALGFVPYKTPPWVVQRLRQRLDPGFRALMQKLRAALDPQGLMAPHCWPLGNTPEE